MSNYATIKKFNTANGEGIRTAIFFTGCDFHCLECFNPELWSPKYGTPYTQETYNEIASSMNSHISGLSVLGGEPFSDYNITAVKELCENFKKDFPSKTIWAWSGFTYEQLMLKDKQCLKDVDILVDGMFDVKLKNHDLYYRGSSNQRIIKVQESLKQNKIILYKEYMD